MILLSIKEQYEEAGSARGVNEFTDLWGEKGTFLKTTGSGTVCRPRGHLIRRNHDLGRLIFLKIPECFAG